MGGGLEVLGVEVVYDVERANRPGGLVERAFVERGELVCRLELLLVIGHDLELALEGVGDRLLVAALFFELGDLAHRLEVLRVDVVDDERVAGDCAVDVVQRVGEKARLAERNAHLVLGRLRERNQPVEEIPRLLGVAAALGVVGELVEHFGVVAVLERFEQCLARGVFVAEALGLERGRELAERRALLAIIEFFSAGNVKIGKIGEPFGVRVLLLDLGGVFVVVGIERARAFDVEQGVDVVARLGQHLGRPDEQRGPRARLCRELRALPEGERGALPLLAGYETALGCLPHLHVLFGLCRLRVRFACLGGLARLFVELAHLAVERGPRGLVLDGRGVVADDLGREVVAEPLLEQLHRRLNGSLVARKERRDPGPGLACRNQVPSLDLVPCPGLACRNQVPSLDLVQLSELFLEADLHLDVGGRCRLLFEDTRELVPSPAALEQPAQVVARGRIAAVERADLLVGLDRRFEIAKLRLAEARDFEKLLLARLCRGVGRAHGMHQHVAKLGVLALLPEIVLDPRERFGMRRIERKDFLVLAERLRLLPFGDERRRLLQGAQDLIGAERRLRCLVGRRPDAVDGTSRERSRRCALRDRVGLRAGLATRFFCQRARGIRPHVFGPPRRKLARAS